MVHLDHIVILVPHASLQRPPPWLTKGFTITPGGSHTDNKTENKLICFRDGSYIELIAFVNDDPKNRKGHMWGRKNFGIVDFAFTHEDGNAVEHWRELQERLAKLEFTDVEVRVDYQRPVAGGRTRPDGKKVEWNVTFPVVSTGYQRGELPFFCYDVTDRVLRVPIEESNITHPNGAYGIKQIDIYVPAGRVVSLVKAYSTILDVENSSPDEKLGLYTVERLRSVDGTDGLRINLRNPHEDTQVQAVAQGIGLLLDLVVGGPDIQWSHEGLR